MKKKKMCRIALVVLVMGIAVACEQSKDTLKLYGNVDIRQVQLAFHDTGRIMRLLLEEGEKAEAGQLIAELDPARYEAAAAQARAQAEAQRKVLARLLAGSRPEEIAQTRARVEGAKATLKDAELTYQRTQDLARAMVVSKQQYDNDRAALEAARANLDEAQQALTLAIKGPRVEDIEAARAQLNADEAALRLAEKELADTKLYAPESGIIQDRILEPGDMAFPQTSVYTMALTNPVWVRAYVSEPDLGKIKMGMRADVTTDSYPGKVYKGWVGFISPTAEFTPKQVETTELRSKLVYRVRVYVCNPENELRLGMPATVTIPLNQPPAAIPANPCQEQ